MSQLPNRTAADDEVLQDLLKALKGGAEQADQRGTLMAFIAKCQTDYMHLHGVQGIRVSCWLINHMLTNYNLDSIRLSKQSRIIDLEEHGLYDLILNFCINKWPDAGIFGPGMPDERYLPPVGLVRNHSYVEHDGIRYGSYHHSSGKGYCYGYIDGRYPVRIEHVLNIDFQGEPELQAVCALVRPFQAPPREPNFPWDTWFVFHMYQLILIIYAHVLFCRSAHFGVSSWAYGRLGQIVAITADRFSGNFTLFDIPMSYGRYWVTVSLDNISPERDDDNDGD